MRNSCRTRYRRTGAAHWVQPGSRTPEDTALPWHPEYPGSSESHLGQSQLVTPNQARHSGLQIATAAAL